MVDDMAKWLARLTHTRLMQKFKGFCCFLGQETLASLLNSSFSWLQERIRTSRHLHKQNSMVSQY